MTDADRLLAINGRLDALATLVAYMLAGPLSRAPEDERKQVLDAIVNMLSEAPGDAEGVHLTAFRLTLERVADMALRRLG